MTDETANDETLEELRELVRRVEVGDQDAVPPLRRWLEDHRVGWAGLAKRAEQLLAGQLNVFAGDNAAARAAVSDFITHLRETCGYDDSSELERLLIDNIVSAALDVRFIELLLFGSDIGDEPHGKYLDARLKRANRRFAEAARQLAMLRRFLPIHAED